MYHGQLGSRATTLGIIGLGAFGRLVARHSAARFRVFAHDIAPGLADTAARLGVVPATLEVAASCDVVAIATPVSSFEAVLSSVAGHCRPGALVLDVGSVKIVPSALMERILPPTVDIVATHPLFGPQSARHSIAGRKIAICPIRGTGHRRLARFLSEQFDLEVILTTPEEHDREAAVVQGLTHLIAKVVAGMGELPTRMTTRSFDLLAEAISLVRDDAPEVFEAIERSNPYSRDVRRSFLELLLRLNCDLDGDLGEVPAGELAGEPVGRKSGMPLDPGKAPGAEARADAAIIARRRSAG